MGFSLLQMRSGSNNSVANGKNLVDGNGELIRKGCKTKKKKGEGSFMYAIVSELIAPY